VTENIESKTLKVRSNIGRKTLAFYITLALSTLLLVTGQITQGTFVAIATVLVPAFCASNVAEHWSTAWRYRGARGGDFDEAN